MTRLRSRLDALVTCHPDLLAIAALALATIPRVLQASSTYLNPDEAWYFFLSRADSFPELYQRSLGTFHPPLFVMLTHYVSKLNDSELALRAMPILAGVAFPWFTYRWLSRVWNPLAGLLALLILAFAPPLISLGAQARGYTLAMLGMAVSLHFMNRALTEKSAWLMAVSITGLYLAILSEYCAAFYAGAAGVYFLVRARLGETPGRPWAVWAAGQTGGIAFYGMQYFLHVKPLASLAGFSDGIPDWLRGTYPEPGGNPVIFLAEASAKQAAYLFGSTPAGVLMSLACLGGWWLLWRDGSGEDRRHRRGLVVLFAVVFLLNASAAFALLYPYGRSRHTAYLALFIAAGVALPLERVLRTRPWLVLPAALALVPLWNVAAAPDPMDISGRRSAKRFMTELVRVMERNIPPGAVILCEGATQRMMAYYLRPVTGPVSAPADRMQAIDGRYRLVSGRYNFRGLGHVLEDSQRLRAECGFRESERIWVVDGGWKVLSPADDPRWTRLAERSFRIGNAALLFSLGGP